MKLIALTILVLVFPSFAYAQHANITAYDPANIISVDTSSEVTAARSDLRQKIFKSTSLNTSLLPAVGVNYMDSVWATTPNLNNIKLQRYTDAGHGLMSDMQTFIPTTYMNPTAGKCGVIVHGGHAQNAVKAPYANMIRKLVEIGCEVTTISMPLAGPNDTNPTVTTDFGIYPLKRLHLDMQIIANKDFNPLAFFMNPPIAAVNDFVDKGITNIAMFGLSGGGWTTDLYAAIDDRVDLSYSLAGSLPNYMRPWVSGSLGDWEQHEIGLLEYDYLDLYILGAAGAGRHKANLYIVNDSCCFGGYNANHFEPTVSAAVSTIGIGEYSVGFDTTVSTHTVSTWAINWVSNDILARF